jgi:hypothetical protein
MVTVVAGTVMETVTGALVAAGTAGVTVEPEGRPLRETTLLPAAGVNT